MKEQNHILSKRQQTITLVLYGCFSQTNEKGQVVTKTSLLKQMEELIEEPGLTCCICREGYKFQVNNTIGLERCLDLGNKICVLLCR